MFVPFTRISSVHAGGRVTLAEGNAGRGLQAIVELPLIVAG